MRLQKVLLLLISFAISQTCFSQNTPDNQPAENWLAQYTFYSAPYLYFRYDRYSKSDIAKFREKLDLMKSSKFSDEWEGIYATDFPDEVGFSELRLHSKIGFVSFYVYTCLPELRSIDYGKIENFPNVIQVTSEFAENSPRKQAAVRYVKVKWNDRHYLVEESSISAFAEKSVGVYVEPKESLIENQQKWSHYWVNGDVEKPLVGLPEFPDGYKKFQRFPIETKIIVVGKRTVGEKTFGDTSYSESAWYAVTVGDGKDKGIKAGMIFDVPKIEGEIIITQVNSKTATGFIHRDIEDNKKDLCVDDKSNKLPCPKIKPSLKAKTQIGNFWNQFF